MNYKIEFTDTLPEDIEEKMRKDLVEYESNHGIDINYKNFAASILLATVPITGIFNLRSSRFTPSSSTRASSFREIHKSGMENIKLLCDHCSRITCVVGNVD